jgi:hypothetical protein
MLALLYVAGSILTSANNLYPHNQGLHCSMKTMQGTSFSSPIMAAHALLVREYFTSGYYPSGEAQPADSFSPSGALIKAMLASSTVALDKIVGNGTRTTTFGDMNQGYGRVQIDNALTFESPATLDGLTLFVMGASDPSDDHYAAISGGDAPHTYTFRTVADTNLEIIRIVLAYTVQSYPSLSFSLYYIGCFFALPVPCLIGVLLCCIVQDQYLVGGAAHSLGNDIDIQVSNETATYYPTVTTTTDGKYDRLNPLEVIVIENPRPNATYTVTVTAHAMVSTQSYAIVILGEGGEGTSAVKYDDNIKKELLSTGTIYILIISAFVLSVICICCCLCGKRKKAPRPSASQQQAYAASATGGSGSVVGPKKPKKVPKKRSADMDARTMGDLYGPPPSPPPPADGSGVSHMMQFQSELDNNL